MSTLETDTHLEILLIRQLGRFQDLLNADAVHRQRLLHEDMAALCNRRRKVLGPKNRGSGKNYHIGKFADVPKCIHSNETSIAGHADLSADPVTQLAKVLFQLIGKDIPHRDQAGIGICFQRLKCRTTTAVAATDQSDFQCGFPEAPCANRSMGNPPNNGRDATATMRRRDSVVLFLAFLFRRSGIDGFQYSIIRQDDYSARPESIAPFGNQTKKPAAVAAGFVINDVVAQITLRTHMASPGVGIGYSPSPFGAVGGTVFQVTLFGMSWILEFKACSR